MKKNTYKVLLTDNDFLMAALTQSEVSVWYTEYPDPVGQIMDRDGIVEGYTPESIKISGARFFRRRFEFRVFIN
ncbi:hypothetical protein NSS98_22680 [Paenibacillus sp. FSL E2-0274]|uniref:hypothetical protein n=1 Tax=Paenibacillus TaxID=44249 RepID=UPI00096DF0EE|nr:hypothetical protein [Paenibacillus odorifer]OME30059.1 hypothetical protein BSK63_19085 [Paenibacillus odorifer]